MFKRTSLGLVLMIVIFLSGCTLPIFGTITEIVYQENKTITSLQDFLSEAQVIADQKIGSGAQAKIISYHYFDNTFSYEVTFAKDGEFLKDNIIKNIVVSYNEDWQVKKQGSFSGHEANSLVNNKIIAVECNRSVMCSTGTANSMADPKNNIDLSSIKFDLNSLINDKYLTSYNSGFIKINNGIPIGNFSRFRFNAITGEIVDSQSIDINKWYEEQAGDSTSLNATEKLNSISIASTSVSTNFDNDSDKDGLTNLQETGYGTNPDMDDTDGDGHSDSEEINNGYNPLGSGKLISDDCLKNSETDKCYLETAKAKKDVSLCQKISTQKEVFQCLFAVNLITKNSKICEDLDKAPENNITDFYNICFKELANISNPAVPTFDRDARTIADVKQLQTAAELYYNDNNSYPASLETLITGDRKQMNMLPIAIKGKSDDCSKDYNYKYTFISRDDYSLTYCIDGLTDVAKKIGINPGVNLATPKGIK